MCLVRLPDLFLISTSAKPRSSKGSVSFLWCLFGTLNDRTKSLLTLLYRNPKLLMKIKINISNNFKQYILSIVIDFYNLMEIYEQSINIDVITMNLLKLSYHSDPNPINKFLRFPKPDTKAHKFAVDWINQARVSWLSCLWPKTNRDFLLFLMLVIKFPSHRYFPFFAYVIRTAKSKKNSIHCFRIL